MSQMGIVVIAFLQALALLQLHAVQGRSYGREELYDSRALEEDPEALASASQEFILPINENLRGKAAREAESDDLHGLMEVFGETTTQGSSKHGKKGLKTDEHGRVQMGVPSDQCDDGKTNLTLDWDGSPVNYTCFHPETRFPKRTFLAPEQDCEILPASYMPDHLCMDKPIHYKDAIPSYGNHRPLWPMFGEYLFVPRERWLHNIEHGAVVMLYHPCARPAEVSRLRQIVTKCVGKHIITPSTFLTPERPLALVAWGCRIQMSLVDDEKAIQFIREKALHGPEGKYPKEGQFEEGLIHWANATGDANYDRVLC